MENEEWPSSGNEWYPCERIEAGDYVRLTKEPLGFSAAFMWLVDQGLITKVGLGEDSWYRDYGTKYFIAKPYLCRPRLVAAP